MKKNGLPKFCIVLVLSVGGCGSEVPRGEVDAAFQGIQNVLEEFTCASQDFEKLDRFAGPLVSVMSEKEVDLQISETVWFNLPIWFEAVNSLNQLLAMRCPRDVLAACAAGNETYKDEPAYKWDQGPTNSFGIRYRFDDGSIGWPFDAHLEFRHLEVEKAFRPTLNCFRDQT